MNKDIEIVFDLYATMLLRIASHYVNEEDAKDLVQDTFVKYMKYNKEFESDEHEKAWLIRTLINLCKNNIKYWWKRKRVDLPIEIFTKNDSQISIIDCIQKLSVKESTIIYLYYFEGYTSKEISNILQMKENTVLSNLKRGRDHLRKMMKGEKRDDGTI